MGSLGGGDGHGHSHESVVSVLEGRGVLGGIARSALGRLVRLVMGADSALPDRVGCGPGARVF